MPCVCSCIEYHCLALQIREPVLASFLHQNIISHSSLGKAMAVLLANKLSSRTLLGTQLMQLISEAYRADPVCPHTQKLLLTCCWTLPVHDAGLRRHLQCSSSSHAIPTGIMPVIADGCLPFLAQSILEACEADLQAVVDRDPACEKFAQALLYFKGFQAIQCHRLNHWLWRNNRRVRRMFHVLRRILNSC